MALVQFKNPLPAVQWTGWNEHEIRALFHVEGVDDPDQFACEAETDPNGVRTGRILVSFYDSTYDPYVLNTWFIMIAELEFATVIEDEMFHEQYEIIS